MSFDMSKFWRKLTDAENDLKESFSENKPAIGDGQRRWPSIIRTATGSNGTRLQWVDCYGWCRVIS